MKNKKEKRLWYVFEKGEIKAVVFMWAALSLMYFITEPSFFWKFSSDSMRLLGWLFVAMWFINFIRYEPWRSC